MIKVTYPNGQAIFYLNTETNDETIAKAFFKLIKTLMRAKTPYKLT